MNNLFSNLFINSKKFIDIKYMHYVLLSNANINNIMHK